MNADDHHHNILHVRKPTGHWTSTQLDWVDRLLLRARDVLHRWWRPLDPCDHGEV